ncbi:U-box domain-containing [Labeo rohita]|uniref:U-box domain-containing n=1 Tax=Labeo rohita TaxID=84645 RepID=A0A498NNV6_LABRO|nr:U-box domain-containing [Labeo rohita]RXN33583.1 U-box domain-containing [Labeo rohita]
MRNCPGGVVYDFEDFVSVVLSSNSKKVEVVELKNADVLNWKDGHSSVKTKKAPNLSKMAVIQLRCGSRSLFFKLTHADAHFTELDFLQAKFELKEPSVLRPHDQGKKNDIIKKLCPFMPPNRRAFWCSLPVSDVVEDVE